MHDGTGQRISLSCKPWNITLSIGEHYLIQAEFVMFMDHQALKFIIQKKNKNAINQMHTLWVVYIQLGDLYDYRSFQIPMEFPLPTRKQAAFPIKPFILSILLYRENATFTGSFLSQPALTLYLPRTLSYQSLSLSDAKIHVNFAIKLLQEKWSFETNHFRHPSSSFRHQSDSVTNMASSH